MKEIDLAQSKIAVVGLGESGLAMLRHCQRAGAQVFAMDSRESPPGLSEAVAILGAERIFTGAVALHKAGERRNQIDCFCISPGISPRESWLQTLVGERPQIGELALFAQALAAKEVASKIVAVTGTNGKSTVVKLCQNLLEASGLSVMVAGNISPSLLAALYECEGSGEWPAVWVLELSSFQLHYPNNLHPDVATVLNVGEDHLDWHSDFDEYLENKFSVFSDTTLMVCNRDDPIVAQRCRSPSIRFGLDEPIETGDFGRVNDPIAWLAHAVASDFELPSKKYSPALPPAPMVKRLLPAEVLRIRGQHNQSNALAALALATAVGGNLASMLHALREFRGDNHRMWSVAVINGVEYINDSKGTNVAAVCAALRSAPEQSVLIAGGQGKGQDFTLLAPLVNQRCSSVLLIGVDALKIETALQSGEPNRTRIEHCESLDEAVERAKKLASPGAWVLFSPGCASFDMFQSYAERGDAFAYGVEELIHAEECNA